MRRSRAVPAARWRLIALRRSARDGRGPAAPDGGGDARRPAARSQWSIFEDHNALIRSGRERRAADARRAASDLGADTLRVAVKWNEVAPAPARRPAPALRRLRPGRLSRLRALRRRCSGARSDDGLARAARPRARRAALGHRGRPPVSAETVNLRPDAGGVRRLRRRGRAALLGRLRGPAAGRLVLDLERAQPHPVPEAAREAPAHLPRRWSRAALPRDPRERARRRAGAGRRDGAGRQPRARSIGPREFVQRWLCLDDRLPAACGGTAAPASAARRRRLRAPPLRPRRARAAQEGHRQPAGDPAARPLPGPRGARGAAARRPADLQHRVRAPEQPARPDRQHHARAPGRAAEREGGAVATATRGCAATRSTCSTTTRRGPGTTPKEIWSGFQTGLRFTDGPPKPAWDAYRLPIVVHRAAARRADLGPRAPRRRRALPCSWSVRARGALDAPAARVADRRRRLLRGPAQARARATASGPSTATRALGTSRTAAPIA